MDGADNNNYKLDDFLDKKGVLIIFTCNHCPYAKASWPILIDLYSQYKNDVEFVAINPNDEKEYPEDSFETMQEKVEEWGINFTYLRDDSQETAKAYNAQCTPDPYLYKVEDNNTELFYHGRINDNWKEPENVESEDLKDALDLLINGEDSPEKQYPSMGCSIKWM